MIIVDPCSIPRKRAVFSARSRAFSRLDALPANTRMDTILVAPFPLFMQLGDIREWFIFRWLRVVSSGNDLSS